MYVFENLLQFYQYLVIDEGNPSDCNSLVKSIWKMSKFSIYFIYIKRHFFKKIFWSRFCTYFLQINTLSKNRSQKSTQVILNMFGAQHFNNNKNPQIYTILPNIFIKTFHLYQVVWFARLITVAIKKICLSWEYFLGDRN